MNEEPVEAHAEDQPVALEEFRATMREAGVEEVVEDILKAFVEETPARLVQLREALAAGDAGSVAKAAHAMKSAAASIRADRFAALLDQLEEVGKSGDTARADALAKPVAAECEAVLRFLAAHTDR